MAMHNYRDCPVAIVISGHPDLHKFFQIINERVFHGSINLIYFESYHARRISAKGINKFFQVLPDILRERRYLANFLAEYFSKMAGYDIYFFSPGYNSLTFYLLKKLGKINRWVYMANVASGKSI